MKLDNVCCIIDDNKSTEYMPDILGKFRAFEWEAVEIDGHDEDSLRKALSKQPVGRPYVVIADTVKGHGVRMFEENHAVWHEKAVSDEDYVIIMEELR